MLENDVDVVLLSVGSDLPYFSGYEAMSSERLTLLVIPSSGEPTLFIPELEAPRVPEGPFDLVAWAEGVDPVELALPMLVSAEKLAVGDHMRSFFLMKLQSRLERRSWVAASQLTSQLRMRKDPAEVRALRSVAHQADDVAARIPSEIAFAGATESAISRRVSQLLLEEGHDEAEFAIVASGPNGASPHHEPGSRVVEDGDVVVIDFGGRLSGYKSDTTRTFAVGQPGTEVVEAHGVVLAANEAARSAIRPGVACEDIDRAARSVIDSAGFGEFFIHRTGHGIGLEVHEHPYMIEGNLTLLEPGMTFSIEPGIYVPERFGIRIEDIVVCGDQAGESLNRSDRRLLVVE